MEFKGLNTFQRSRVVRPVSCPLALRRAPVGQPNRGTAEGRIGDSSLFSGSFRRVAHVRATSPWGCDWFQSVPDRFQTVRDRNRLVADRNQSRTNRNHLIPDPNRSVTKRFESVRDRHRLVPDRNRLVTLSSRLVRDRYRSRTELYRSVPIGSMYLTHSMKSSDTGILGAASPIPGVENNP